MVSVRGLSCHVSVGFGSIYRFWELGRSIALGYRTAPHLLEAQTHKVWGAICHTISSVAHPGKTIHPTRGSRYLPRARLGRPKFWPIHPTSSFSHSTFSFFSPDYFLRRAVGWEWHVLRRQASGVVSSGSGGRHLLWRRSRRPLVLRPSFSSIKAFVWLVLPSWIFDLYLGCDLARILLGILLLGRLRRCIGHGSIHSVHQYGLISQDLSIL